MSILINMEMPTDCDNCSLFDDRFDYSSCNATGHSRGYNWNPRGQRMPDCPLIEVPPHGRLIDADVLIQEVDNYSFRHDQEVPRYLTYEDFCDAVIDDLEDAPTVIPADKDGET